MSHPSWLRDPARALALVLLVNAVLNLAIATCFAPPWNETVFSHVVQVARREGGSDSWAPMAAGLAHLEARDPRPLYRTLLIEGRIKFVYPPPALLAYEGARGLGRVLGLRRSTEGVLGAAAWASLFATALATALLLRPGREGVNATAAVLAGVAALTFYPAVKAVTLGQFQALITAAQAAALLCLQRGHAGAAGALTGLVCLVKPHFAVLGVWAWRRREHRFLLAGAAAAAVPLVAAVWRYGVSPHLDYLNALSFLGRHGESYYANQSMMGLLHRLLGNGNNAEWVATAYPPVHPVVVALSLATSLALIALALAKRAPGTPREADFGLALLAVTMASPLAWEHHYGVLAPIFVLLLPEIAREETPRWRRLALGASYVLSANFFAVAQRLAGTPWNPLQSYLYFAAGLALVLLVTARPAVARVREGASAALPSAAAS